MRSGLLLLILCASFSATAANPSVRIYAAPGASGVGTIDDPADIYTAVALAGDIAATAVELTDIQILLKPGQYTLEAPLVFGDDFSGSNHTVVMQPDQPGHKPMLHGSWGFAGNQCDGGWKSISNRPSSVPSQVRKCTLPASVQSKLAGLRDAVRTKEGPAANLFTQLFVNGIRQTRSRTPNAAKIVDVFKTSAGAHALLHKSTWAKIPASIPAATGVEFVFSHQWQQPRALIAAIEPPPAGGANSTVRLDFGSDAFTTLNGLMSTGKGHFENHWHFIDSTGEWYVDEQPGLTSAGLPKPMVLYYYPPPGVAYTAATTYYNFPVNKNLIRLGDPGSAQVVNNIAFNNLHFVLSRWALRNRRGGQNSYIFHQAGCGLGGLIDGRYVKNLKIEKSIFGQWGLYAISLGGNRTGYCADAQDGLADNVEILNNVFEDGGAGAIRVDSFKQKTGRFSAVIEYNDIRDTGRVFGDTPAILILNPPRVRIAFNKINSTPYSGISAGLGCRYDQYDKFVILDNEVTNTMRLMLDGGALYTNGGQGLIQRNKLSIVALASRDPDAYNPANVALYLGHLYLDDRSIYYDVQNNTTDSILEKSPTHYFAGNTNFAGAPITYRRNPITEGFAVYGHQSVSMGIDGWDIVSGPLKDPYSLTDLPCKIQSDGTEITASNAKPFWWAH